MGRRATTLPAFARARRDGRALVATSPVPAIALARTALVFAFAQTERRVTAFLVRVRARRAGRARYARRLVSAVAMAPIAMAHVAARTERLAIVSRVRVSALRPGGRALTVTSPARAVGLASTAAARAPAKMARSAIASTARARARLGGWGLRATFLAAAACTDETVRLCAPVAIMCATDTMARAPVLADRGTSDRPARAVRATGGSATTVSRARALATALRYSGSGVRAATYHVTILPDLRKCTGTGVRRIARVGTGQLATPQADSARAYWGGVASSATRSLRLPNRASPPPPCRARTDSAFVSTGRTPRTRAAAPERGQTGGTKSSGRGAFPRSTALAMCANMWTRQSSSTRATRTLSRHSTAATCRRRRPVSRASRASKSQRSRPRRSLLPLRRRLRRTSSALRSRSRGRRTRAAAQFCVLTSFATAFCSSVV
eukprot:Opistho-1_new@64455